MHHYPAAFRVLADPFENLKTIHPGHIQVEQKRIRKRITDAILINPVGAQISQRLPTVRDRMQHSRSARFLKRVPNKKHVVGIILGKQNVYSSSCAHRTISEHAISHSESKDTTT